MTPTDFPRVEAPSTTSDRTTDPSPADVVARLRKAVHDGEAYAGTLPAKEAVKLRPKDWHAITGEARRAADLITLLQARAEKAEAEAAALRERVEALEGELEWYGENARLCRLIHSGGDAGRNALAEDGGKRAARALANKETENVA